MKINIKEGLRRILTVMLTMFSVYYLFIFIVSGFIFWNIDYIEKAKVINLSNNNKISLIDFSQKYFEKKKELYDYNEYYFKSLGFKVHPYKKYFVNYDNHKFVDNEIYTINSANYQIKLPSVFQYVIMQILQFLLIPLCNLLLIGLYFLIESTIIWIIKGFKE